MSMSSAAGGIGISSRNRHVTAAEAMVNGFILSDYQLSGGRPQPSTTRLQIKDSADIRYETNGYTVVGSEWGWLTPRVATELATVPPMFVHDRLCKYGQHGAFVC